MVYLPQSLVIFRNGTEVSCPTFSHDFNDRNVRQAFYLDIIETIITSAFLAALLYIGSRVYKISRKHTDKWLLGMIMFLNLDLVANVSYCITSIYFDI